MRKLAQELLRLVSYACLKILYEKEEDDKNGFDRFFFLPPAYSKMLFYSPALSCISLSVGLFSRLKAYLAISC